MTSSRSLFQGVAATWSDGVLDHHNGDIMSAMASQITGVSIVCPTVCFSTDQRKHQSFASLAFMRGIHRWSVDSPHEGLVTRKMLPFDDVIVSTAKGSISLERRLSETSSDFTQHFVVYFAFYTYELVYSVISDRVHNHKIHLKHTK